MVDPCRWFSVTLDGSVCRSVLLPGSLRTCSSRRSLAGGAAWRGTRESSGSRRLERAPGWPRCTASPAVTLGGSRDVEEGDGSATEGRTGVGGPSGRVIAAPGSSVGAKGRGDVDDSSGGASGDTLSVVRIGGRTERSSSQGAFTSSGKGCARAGRATADTAIKQPQAMWLARAR
jgi:hypothetical protein